ncbi:hypothetical protein OnM2_012010 [Erysiphe neolycopersici]|uniref:RRM domain-containing protein n=1 Tax=Erysiphe neolycopersici TaxID=212602 RepID=A0A420I657_9PEZI|nr:hypothetical protein OnM2_012010 [Erysiphe neolycopersici]
MEEFKFLGEDKKPFIGFFEKYANNLGEFIDWITDQAINCGYLPKGDKFTQNASSSSRLKGKARKKMQEKQNNPSMSNDGSKFKNREYILVNVKELIIIADQIVKHQNSTTVIPERIIRAGIFAITKLNDYRIKLNSLENEMRIGNLVFESILKEVIVKLQPCLRFPGQNLQSTEVLDYEALRQLIGSEGIPWLCVRLRTKVTFNEDLDDEKIALQQLNTFALFSVFIDFNEIYSPILNTWQKYKDGEIDSITASIITNVGFHVAIRQCDGFKKNSSPHYQDALSLILLELNYTNEEFLSTVDRGILGWIFSREFLILDELRTRYFSDRSFFFPRSQDQNLDIGWFNTEDGRYLKSSVRFSMVFNQIRLMKNLNIYPYSEDELTKGILDILNNKLVPLWLPFILRVFLDIDILLDDRVVEAFLQLRLISEQVVEQQTRFFENSPLVENLSLCSWAYKNSLSKMIEGVTKDVISASQPGFGDMLNDKSRQFSLLKNHPVLSGFTAFYICKGIYRLGVNMCNLSKEVGLAWQIYTSMSLRGFSLAPWPLMDTLNELYVNDIEDKDGLSNREISDLIRNIGKISDINITQERSSNYSLKDPLFIFFLQVDSIRLMFPEFSGTAVSGSPNFHSFMVNRFLRINSPKAEELPSDRERMGNSNPMQCYDVDNFLEYFSNAIPNVLGYLLFPFLTLKEQCFRVLLAINVAQTINQQNFLMEDQAGGSQPTENSLAPQSTNLQSSSRSIELTPELDLIISTINTYTEDWAYNGVTRTNWPIVLSTFPGMSQEFMDYWKTYFSKCQMNIKYVHETENSNSNLNENQPTD